MKIRRILVLSLVMIVLAAGAVYAEESTDETAQTQAQRNPADRFSQFVEAGIISQSEADALVEFFEENKPEGERPERDLADGERPKGGRFNGELPDGERSERELPDGEMPQGGRANMLQSAVDEGIITQEQADEMMSSMPQGRGMGGVRRGGFAGCEEKPSDDA